MYYVPPAAALDTPMWREYRYRDVGSIPLTDSFSPSLPERPWIPPNLLPVDTTSYFSRGWRQLELDVDSEHRVWIVITPASNSLCSVEWYDVLESLWKVSCPILRCNPIICSKVPRRKKKNTFLYSYYCRILVKHFHTCAVVMLAYSSTKKLKLQVMFVCLFVCLYEHRGLYPGNM